MIFGLFMAKLEMNYYYYHYSYYFVVGWWYPKSDPQKKVLAVWTSNFLLESFRTWFGISGALCNNAHQPSLLASFSCALLDSFLLCSLLPRRKIHAKIRLAATHFCSFDLRFITGSGRSQIRSFSFRLLCFFFLWLVAVVDVGKRCAICGECIAELGKTCCYWVCIFCIWWHFLPWFSFDSS